MKSFIYKLILVMLSVIIVYKLTIGDEISSFIKKTNSFTTKEGRKNSVNKLRTELERAIKKDSYLSDDDARLINAFIKKIKNELEKAGSQ